MSRPIPAQVLTIASSDSGGGAGIQADIKAIQANGAYALSVIVAVTAQNTRAVTLVHPLPREVIEAQIEAVFDDFDLGAVKTGMLFSSEIVEAVSSQLGKKSARNLIVDPVMVSKGGEVLLKPDAVESMKKSLFPLALLVTPNILEAEQLAGGSIRSLQDAEAAARAIRDLGPANILIKGGHLESDPGTDLWYDGVSFTRFPGEWIRTKNTHGTGCSYASAIAAQLAKGFTLRDAIAKSRMYITEAIRSAPSIGQGHGPIHHYYFLDK